MLLLSPPYRLLVLAALALLVASFFTANQTVYVELRATFYVFDLPTLLWALSFGLFLLWLLYEVNKRWLYSRQLTGVHVGLTLVSAAAALAMVLWINHQMQDRSPLSLEHVTASQLPEWILWLSILLLLAVQAVFLFNVIMGLVRDRKQR